LIVANTMKMPASFALEVQSLRPVRTYSSPCTTARAVSAKASLPAPASDSA